MILPEHTTAFSCFELAPSITPWEWARQNIDYSQAPSYDTEYRGPFDPDLMPFWKEPLEAAVDPNVREIVIPKCSRGGFSENFALTLMRYVIARDPRPTLYLSGEMLLAQGFMDTRVKRGMKLSQELMDIYSTAYPVRNDIQFPLMDLRVIWVNNASATKQDGWELICADEVSTWSGFNVDLVRKRTGAYRFYKIIWGSSIDPTRKGNPEYDPIILLWKESNQSIWMMPDPETGRLFSFACAGLTWPDECKIDDEWNLKSLDAVRQTAYYETPDGTHIYDDERMDVVRTGRWVPTFDVTAKLGYKIVSPMVPFACGDFSELAFKFLSAKHRLNPAGSKQERLHNPIRVYFAEDWTEVKREKKLAPVDETLLACEQDYEMGTIWVPKDSTHGIFVTADVQKYHIWRVARVWSIAADTSKVETALLEFGNSASMLDFDEKVAEFSPRLTGVDIGYEQRATDVADYCAQYTESDPLDSLVMALRGSSQLVKSTIDAQVRDAMEGRKRARSESLFLELVWATDVFRTWLVDAMNGDSDTTWTVPAHRDARQWQEYIKQVTTTKKLDGEWIGPTHGQDHLFDCEAQQFVLARWNGLIR